MINSIRLFIKQYKFLSFVKPALIFILFSLLFWQCISPPDYLGGDLITSHNKYQVKVDTLFSLSAFTLPYDTANTMSFNDAVLGETYDEIFGRTKSSFLTQLRLSALEHSYGDSVQIDSVFLFLRLNDRLGNEPINVSVYELIDSLSVDSTYNAFASVEGFYHPVPISSRNLNPYNGDESVLKIAINRAWVDSTLISADSVSMSTSNLFSKHLYGIYVKTEGTFASPAKGMYYFDYLSETSRLVVYYRNKEQDSVSMSFSYPMNSLCVRFNHYEHDFSMVQNIFNDTINSQDSVFYLKGLYGTRGVIVLDSIFNWLDSMPIVIHRAELRLEIEDHPGMPPDTLVNQLFIYKKQNNQYVSLVDFQINSDLYGGKYIKSKKYYSFNITFHIQQLLSSGSPDKVLYIEPILSYSRANSVVLRTGSHSRRMKLIITYTKL